MKLAIILIFASTILVRSAVWPAEEWQRASPADTGLDETKLLAARDYALTAEGSGYIVRGGELVISWGDPHKLYDLKSTTKSFGAAALGLAIKDGKFRLSDKARQHHPTLGVPPSSNVATGWLDEITVLHLASQLPDSKSPAAIHHYSSHPAHNGTTAIAVPTGSPNASRSTTEKTSKP